MLINTLKWIGVSLGGLFAVLLIANAIFVWRSGEALKGRLEKIRDAGEPVRIADLARKPIPPEKNAAVYLRRANKDLTAMGKDLSAFYDSEAYQNDQLGPAELKTLEEVIQSYPQAPSLVEQAAACPDYDPQLDCSLAFDAFFAAAIDHIGNLRGAARLVDHRATVLLAHGQRDEAMRCAINLLQLARHYDKEPMLVGFLVALACRGIGMETANRVLRSGPVGDPARDALDTELAQHDITQSFRGALISERAIGLTGFNNQNLGQFWPARGLWNNAVIYYLDVMEHQLAQASRPYDKALHVGPDTVSKPVTPWTALADQVVPALQASRDATERSRATMRSLRILNGVTRLEQQGVKVTGLVDLKLPKEKTIDPFTGKPLLMKKLAEGWVIYSVGSDLKDDGGQVDEHADFGLAPMPPLPSLE